MPADHPHRPRAHPPVGRGRARLPPGAGHQRRRGRAAGLGRPADSAGQMPVRFPRLGGWRRFAARLRSRGGRRPHQALAIYRLRRPITIERDDCARGPLVARRRARRRRPPPGRRSAGAGSAPPARAGASGWLEHRLRLGVCRRPRRAWRHPLARMQCGRTERRQLHQGLLRRPGKYRADELAAPRSTGGWWWSKATATRPRVASLIPSSACRSSTRGVDAIPDNAIVPAWLQAAITA